MFHFVLNTPLGPLTIYAIGSILMFDWVLDTPLTCLKKDKNCEKTCKGVIFRITAAKTRNNFWEISEKNSAEKWFSSQLLSASFVRNPEAAIRGVLQRKLFLTVSQYLQENTCVGVSFWYSSRPSGLQLYQKKLHTGVFLLIFWNF